MRDNYRTIAARLAAREPFNGESLRGIDNDGAYCVVSYSTLLLQTYPDGSVKMYNNRYYSQTTSRHQALIRAAFPDATGGYSDRVVYDYLR